MSRVVYLVIWNDADPDRTTMEVFQKREDAVEFMVLMYYGLQDCSEDIEEDKLSDEEMHQLASVEASFPPSVKKERGENFYSLEVLHR